MNRLNGRKYDELRKVKITKGVNKFAEGSCLIEVGLTKVMCTASVEEQVPIFLRDSGRGWVTAEYGMLPRACNSRTPREASRGKLGGRTQEIQRLIGRSLRQAIDLKLLGQRTVWIDCDVIQADGGTRTASITGGCVVLHEAVKYLLKNKKIDKNPIKNLIAAVSVGMKGARTLLDLDYLEDSSCDVDMNVVMTAKDEFIEVQGTGEGSSYTKKELDQMIVLAKKGIKELIQYQKRALKIK